MRRVTGEVARMEAAIQRLGPPADEPDTGQDSPLRRRGGGVRGAPHRPPVPASRSACTTTKPIPEIFDECRTGLDHISFAVADRASLDAWAGWLDELDVEHSGAIDVDQPMPYSVVVFRDPDNIQLELIYLAT
jgi:catechol 2,3-dioxygenase-like lactoylglutathione lyase family enzyme